jgi:hypothetical protein
MEAVLERVRKLLARSKSDNVHEASLAAEMAQRLMTEHKLHMSDVEIAAEAAQPVVSGEALNEGQASVTTWQVRLLGGVARANSCRILIRSSRRGLREGRLTVYGKQADVDSTLYLYRYFAEEINRLCKAWGDEGGYGRAARNSFRVGAANSIRQRLSEARAAEQARWAEGGAAAAGALVHLRSSDAAAEEHVNKIAGDGARGWAASAPTSARGYVAGQHAARGINIGGARSVLAAPSKQIRGGSR